MASPVDAARATTGIAAATSPWTVNLPASIAAGDTLIILGRAAFTPTLTLPSGWSWLLQNDQSDAADDTTSIIYKKATGLEGATLSLTQSTSVRGATICWRITGAADPTVTPPALSSVVIGTGSAPNPPSLAPTGGSKDYLWLEMVACDGAVTFGSSLNYSNPATVSDGGGGAGSAKCTVAGASRQLTAASEDPGTIGLGSAAATGYTTVVVAVYPSAPAKSLLLPGPAHRHPLLRR